MVNEEQVDTMVGPGGVRSLAARWLIQGTLKLTSAAHLGGEETSVADQPLLRDPSDGSPLLSGSSLAGALRSHLNDLRAGYFSEKEAPEVTAIFGGERGDDHGGQSPLIVFDSRGVLTAPPEIRDGVAIDGETGTASDRAKFDLEVLPAGTCFPLRFELLIGSTEDETAQLGSLAATLRGLERGEIAFGARKSRGFGRAEASAWRARRFDLRTAEGWLAWLGTDHENPLPDGDPHASIDDALGGASAASVDQRERFVARCRVRWRDSSLLVRSPGMDSADADVSHLRSASQDVLPGTSLAGALRARALRIARCVRAEQDDAEQWVAELFGPRDSEDLATENQVEPWPRASRLICEESLLEGAQRLRPVRVRIDRFTGGVVDGGLFDEEPIYGGSGNLRLEIRNPRAGEVGLVLLILKDLLTGDLPLGGGAAVGRGVVTGSLTADWQQPGIETRKASWNPEEPLDPETAEWLNGEVELFHSRARSEVKS